MPAPPSYSQHQSYPWILYINILASSAIPRVPIRGMGHRVLPRYEPDIVRVELPYSMFVRFSLACSVHLRISHDILSGNYDGRHDARRPVLKEGISMENEPVFLKAKVYQEIELLPDDKLNEVYEMIHTYRLALETTGQPMSTAASILQLAGSWSDLPDADFAIFLDEIQQRRQRAFLGRQI